MCDERIVRNSEMLPKAKIRKVIQFGLKLAINAKQRTIISLHFSPKYNEKDLRT